MLTGRLYSIARWYLNLNNWRLPEGLSSTLYSPQAPNPNPY